MEFAVLEQEAFPATKVARDQDMSIGGVFFAPSHDGTMTAVSTRMSFDIEEPVQECRFDHDTTCFASNSRGIIAAYMLFIHRSARTQVLMEVR